MNLTHHFVSCPSGGTTTATGLNISWQDGPIENGTPNGATLEVVIQAAIDRLEFFQDSKFKCQENQDTINHLKAALAAMEARRQRRLRAGTENTYKGN